MIHSNDQSGGKKPHGDGDDSPETFADEAPAVLQKPQVTEHPIPMTDEHDNLVVPQIEDSPPAGSYPRPPQPMAGADSKPSEAEEKLPPKIVTSQKKPATPSAPLPPLVPQPQGAQPTTDGLPPLPPLPTVSQPQPTPVVGGGGKQPPVPGRPAGAFTPQPQPLPPEQKKELEKKAKQMVKDLDALRPKGGSGSSIKPKQKGKGAGLKYTVAGLLLVVVGAGTFFGIRLLQTEQAADIRQQAADFRSAGNYCNQSGCYLPSSVFPGCYVNHYVCDSREGAQYGCQDRLVASGVQSASFQRDCGMEQIDIFCTSSSPVFGWASWVYDYDCSTQPPPPPPPTVTPTPSRPNYCVSLTINPSSLAPGQSTTLTSTSNTAVNNYWFAFYNMDNLYSPNNAKPICVPAGVGDNSTYKDSCPDGYYHLHYKDPSTALRTSGTKTLTYNQVFVYDYNRNASNTVMGTAKNVRVNAYMSLTGGLTSLPVDNCRAEVVQASAPTPTRTPTPRPTATPTRAPTPTRTPTPRPPTPTPTVPAACNSVCTTNSQCPSGLICSGGFCRNSQCTSQTNCICPAPTATLTPAPSATPTLVPLACMELNYSPVQPVLGTTIDLTCVGSPLDRVERAEYQYSVNGGAFSAISNVTDLTARLFIGDPGSYTVRCRVCNGQTCTAWDTL